ncbi:unnamed protein product [Protopolystoma xenopodis]|uniref:Uncharacterized protein n=1 Tax=Protopolystoma xenopodis TaxID=117903 RepID=A0A448XLC1_9PLAT|nr:unnamed protein product [Protopolystoma xenopodis]
MLTSIFFQGTIESVSCSLEYLLSHSSTSFAFRPFPSATPSRGLNMHNKPLNNSTRKSYITQSSLSERHLNGFTPDSDCGVESGTIPIASVPHTSLVCSAEFLHPTPEAVLEICWSAISNKKTAFSVTRRSAGLWPAVRAALVAEGIRSKAVANRSQTTTKSVI